MTIQTGCQNGLKAGELIGKGNRDGEGSNSSLIGEIGQMDKERAMNRLVCLSPKEKVVVEVVANVGASRKRVQHGKALATDGDQHVLDGDVGSQDSWAVGEDGLVLTDDPGVVGHGEVVAVDGSIFEPDVSGSASLT